MNAYNCILRISETDILNYDFKYCLVGEKKVPFRYDGIPAKTIKEEDFCSIEKLINNNIEKFLGIGISVNFSNVIAIDIDKCFSIPFDINSIDNRGKEILELFKDYYCEFSFSGTGIRIIMLNNNIKEDFKNTYYIKNKDYNIEIYYPQSSFRYVTLTGKFIYNNKIKLAPKDIMKIFLEKYMKRPEKTNYNNLAEDNLSEDEIRKNFKKLLIFNTKFQEVWFSQAPGSGKNESELDYYLLVNLLENVTSNSIVVKKLFEESDYYLSKDKNHKRKWNETNYALDTIELIKRR